jgi:predicted Zn-dependent peptidase
MIKYRKYRLDNGLRVLVHEDRSTPLVALNILYDAGSRDERPSSTGLAHLLEHLMFSGTSRVPDFDRQLQAAGGDNNAFTTPDITNYHMTIPAENIETGLWLEADRMTGPDLSRENVDVQKNVVSEEFNQRYLNQPYGDAMHLLRPLAYKVHPYMWPTIGKSPEEIRSIDIEEIKAFFRSYYSPCNAIMSITGNITASRSLKLIKKWFDNIEPGKAKTRNIPVEPEQVVSNSLTVERNVPVHALYKAWHTGARTAGDFYTLDLVTDLLAGGESGRLNTRLTREKRIFSDIDIYITADIDPGLIILHGRLMNGVDMHRAEESVEKVIDSLVTEAPRAREVEKVKNKYESASIHGYTNILNKAISLSYFELLGDADLINNEVRLYRETDRMVVTETASRVFRAANCSTLYYNSSGNY